MRMPTNLQLIFIAVVLFLIGTATVGDYYPAKHPLVGTDGSVLHSSDGRVLIDTERYHNDMQHYHGMLLPFYFLSACSLMIAGYVIVRVVAGTLSERRARKAPTS